MAFDERIDEYLEGRLSSAEADDLFHTIAVSPEKRDTFERSLALKMQLRAEATASPVPDALAGRVLAAALAGAPAAVAPTVAGASRTMLVVGALLLAGGIGIGLVIGRVVGTSSTAALPTTSHAESVVASVGAPATPSASNAQSTDVASARTPGVHRSPDGSSTVSSVPKSGVPRRATLNARSSGMPAPGAVIHDTIRIATAQAGGMLERESNPAPSITQIAVAPPMVMDLSMPAPASAALPMVRPTSSSDAGTPMTFSLELGRAFAAPSTVYGTGDPLVNTYAVRAAYRLGSWALGGELGSALFTLRYTDAPDAQTSRTIAQRSTVTVAALTCERTVDVSAVINPTVRAELGATELGPFAGAAASFDFMSFGPLRATAQMWYRALSYSHSGSAFVSGIGGAGVGVTFDARVSRSDHGE